MTQNKSTLYGKVTSGISQIPLQQTNTTKTAKVEQTDNIYGELSEKVIRPVYEGVDTPSFDITIDNENKTISGNVNFNEFTGETSGKAYPGHLGKRNFDLIVKLENSVNELFDKYTLLYVTFRDLINGCDLKINDVEKELNNKLNTLNNNFEQTVQHINKQLSDLKTHVDAQDSILLEKIQLESQERLQGLRQVQQNLTAQIKLVTDKITAEENRAVEQEQLLQSSIDKLDKELADIDDVILTTIEPQIKELDQKILDIQNETITTIDVRLTELDQKIDIEEERATAAEQSILEQSLAYTNKVKDDLLGDGIKETFDTLVEIQNWIETDGVNTYELSEALTAEASIRENKDTELEQLIEQETLRATTSEELLSVKITAEETRATAAEETEKLAREAAIVEVQNNVTTQVNTLTDKIDQETFDRAQADSQLFTAMQIVEQTVTEQNTKIETLSGDISDEEARATAAEKSIDDKLTEFMNLFSSLQFIDGGTSSSLV